MAISLLRPTENKFESYSLKETNIPATRRTLAIALNRWVLQLHHAIRDTPKKSADSIRDSCKYPTYHSTRPPYQFRYRVPRQRLEKSSDCTYPGSSTMQTAFLSCIDQYRSWLKQTSTFTTLRVCHKPRNTGSCYMLSFRRRNVPVL